MITSILTAAVIFCLYYGRLPPLALAPLCAGLGAALTLSARHGHRDFLTIDILAQVSRLNTVNPTLKFLAALALMVICVLAKSTATGVFLTAAMLLLTICAGHIKPRDYLRLLALPVSFLMLGALALLFEVKAARSGVIGIPALGYWLCVSEQAQSHAALVIWRAMGAVSCLYALSLSTPMSELIGVLRRVRCPDVLITLMFLIYRYIFILLTMHHTMRAAAKSRLGYIDLRAGMRSTGNLYASLLSRGYRQASVNFDAMESRCFDTEIRFLESGEKARAIHISIAAGVALLALSLSLPGWIA